MLTLIPEELMAQHSQRLIEAIKGWQAANALPPVTPAVTHAAWKPLWKPLVPADLGDDAGAVERLATQLLIRARRTLTDERNWCRGVFSQVYGQRLQYCALGAIRDAIFDTASPLVANAGLRATERLKRAAELGWGLNVAEVNDQQGHAAVLDMFDAAINEAK